jgi:hypothetical protein
MLRLRGTNCRARRGRHPADIREEKWAECLLDLQEFVRENDRCPSRGSEDAREKSIGTWLRTQRALHKKGELTQERIDKLNIAMPKWEGNIFEENWQKKLEVLIECISATQCLPSRAVMWTHKKTEWNIGKWLYDQRVAYDGGALSQKRLSALDAAAPGWRTPLSGKETPQVQAVEEPEARSNEEIPWAQALAQVGWI